VVENFELRGGVGSFTPIASGVKRGTRPHSSKAAESPAADAGFDGVCGAGLI
jgi:hypothetical protein